MYVMPAQFSETDVAMSTHGADVWKYGEKRLTRLDHYVKRNDRDEKRSLQGQYPVYLQSIRHDSASSCKGTKENQVPCKRISITFMETSLKVYGVQYLCVGSSRSLSVSFLSSR